MDNKQTLHEKIIKLLNEPFNTSLEVYAMGNILHILKESDSCFYLLLIPLKPLDDILIEKIKGIGFIEAWKAVNYFQYIEFSDGNDIVQLTHKIEHLFINLLKLDASKPWRFIINSGMELLKDCSVPTPTTSERRSKNKKDKKIQNVLFNDYTYSIFLTIFIITIIQFKSRVPIININSILIILFISFLFVKVTFRINLPILETYRLRKFLNQKNSDFFSQNGFTKVGERYRGNIKGFKVELCYTGKNHFAIIVYHKEISWARVLELPGNNIFSSTTFDWAGMFYSIKKVQFILNSPRLIIEAITFVDMLINLKFETQE